MTTVPAPRANLDDIETAALQLVQAIVPTNTRLAFAQDWAVWTAFCEAQGFDPLTVSSGLLVAFVSWLATDTPERPAQAPETCRRRISGVVDGWRKAGLDIPRGVARNARKVALAYARNVLAENRAVGRGPASPLTVADLRRVVAACPDTVAGKRDRAMILLGFAIAARRSELAGLLVSDIVEGDGGLMVSVRVSKTGGRTVAVPYGTDPATCPVRGWRAWLDATGVTDGRAFRTVHASGRLGERINPDSVSGAITAAGERAGLPYKLTGHSLRHGLATEARRAGHDVKVIAAQGGWVPNSKTLYGYMQIIDKWTDNAVQGIGL